jgi:hypothetical protein
LYGIQQERRPKEVGVEDGAGDEIRTRDIQHGKLMLYQLSYSRNGCVFNQCLEGVKQTLFVAH